MSKKLNILFVHNYYRLPGGEDIVVKNEKQLLEKNGHNVILYSRDNSEIDNFTFKEKICFPFNAIFCLKTYTDIRKIIEEKKIDIVHVHNTLGLISPSVYYAAFYYNVPVIQTVHNFRLICPGALLYRNGKICEECIDKGLRCALKHNCYRNNKAQTFISICILTLHRILGTYKKVNFICLTEFNKEKLLAGKNSKYFCEEKMFIKPNFTVGFANVIPYEKRKKQFLYVGRPEKAKGIQILLNAWKQIKKYQLLILGTSDEMDWCEQFILDNELCNVTLMGKVDNKEARLIMAESLALIMPTQLYEGFPMTLVESFSCGTPVIGSDLGNVGNIIINGENGIKFKSNSVEDLIKKVNCISDMTNSSWKFYNDHFSPEKNYKVLIDIYNQMIS